ncbi:MAG: DUF2905 domain-containing protein [Peptococcaceae bacterium]|nr:DUF2905 domain-containing protein [Peptococcaceae bacterium]
MDGMQIGKMLIMLGLVFVVLGGIVMFVSKFTGLGHLPGDIFIKSENGSFYFPIVSCIIISVVLSLILNLFNR